MSVVGKAMARAFIQNRSQRLSHVHVLERTRVRRGAVPRAACSARVHSAGGQRGQQQRNNKTYTKVYDCSERCYGLARPAVCGARRLARIRGSRPLPPPAHAISAVLIARVCAWQRAASWGVGKAGRRKAPRSRAAGPRAPSGSHVFARGVVRDHVGVEHIERVSVAHERRQKLPDARRACGQRGGGGRGRRRGGAAARSWPWARAGGGGGGCGGGRGHAHPAPRRPR